MNSGENLESYISPVPALGKEAETRCCRLSIALGTHEVEKKMPPNLLIIDLSLFPEKRPNRVRVALAVNFIQPTRKHSRYRQALKDALIFIIFIRCWCMSTYSEVRMCTPLKAF